MGHNLHKNILIKKIKNATDHIKLTLHKVVKTMKFGKKTRPNLFSLVVGAELFIKKHQKNAESSTNDVREIGCKTISLLFVHHIYTKRTSDVGKQV